MSAQHGYETARSADTISGRSLASQAIFMGGSGRGEVFPSLRPAHFRPCNRLAREAIRDAMVFSAIRRRWNAQHPDAKRFYKNWIVVFTMGSVVGVGYYISVTTLHQFVTSSAQPSDPTVQPGLGLSEVWYSWIVSVASVGLLIGSITLGFLVRWFYAKYLFVGNLLVCIAGGVLYAAARNGWMLLASRFTVGLFVGGQITMLRVYLAESSIRLIAMLPPEKQKTSTIKYTAYFIYFTSGIFCVMLGPGIGAIAAEIPGLDQFRWPGYFLIISSAILAVIVLVCMREKWSDFARDDKYCHCSLNKIPVPLYTIPLVVFANLIVQYYLSTVEALQNPILANSFGLTIKYTAYVFIGTLAFGVLAPVLIYILQKFKVDNRKISLLAFMICTMGSIIATDWQALSGDPCDQFSESNVFRSRGYHCYDIDSWAMWEVYPNSSQSVTPLYYDIPVTKLCGGCSECNLATLVMLYDAHVSLQYDVVCELVEASSSIVSFHCYSHQSSGCLSLDGNTTLNDSTSWLALFDERPSIVTSENTATHYLLVRLENFTHTDLECVGMDLWSGNDSSADGQCPSSVSGCSCNASCICEAFSSPPYNCFWNPNSRITGEHCPRCEPLCRSRQNSLNLVQFFVGVVLITLGYQMGRAILTVLASDLLGQGAQGIVLAMIVASGSVARLTGPLWGNAVYLAVGRRTYIDMNILTVLMVVVIVLFLLLYRKMDVHRQRHSGGEQSDSTSADDIVLDGKPDSADDIVLDGKPDSADDIVLDGEPDKGFTNALFFDEDILFRESQV